MKIMKNIVFEPQHACHTLLYKSSINASKVYLRIANGKQAYACFT